MRFTATVDRLEWLGSELFAHFDVEKETRSLRLGPARRRRRAAGEWGAGGARVAHGGSHRSGVGHRRRHRGHVLARHRLASTTSTARVARTCSSATPRSPPSAAPARTVARWLNRGTITTAGGNARSGDASRPSSFFALIIAGLVVILILQNTRDTQVHLLFWDVTAGLWTLLLGAVVLGMLLGWLLPKLRRNRRGDLEVDD